MQLQPIGLIGATLFIQLCVLTVIVITSRLLPQRGFVLLRSRCDRAALLLALATVGCMVASDEMYRAWSPILGDLASEHGIGRSTTYFLLFVLDLIVAFRLMILTGGSKSSPFTSILFLMPTLAVFLREPPIRFLSYSALAAILYLVGLVVERSHLGPMDVLRGEFGPPPDYGSIRTDTPAHALVNLGCLAIAAATGYLTRPLPL